MSGETPAVREALAVYEIEAPETERVPSGYRQTDVGVIPEDWCVESLGEASAIKTGEKNNEDKSEDGQYPFFVRSQIIERINTYSHDGEAILVPGEGLIGNIFHYINGKFDYHQRVYKISDFAPNVDAKYLYYYMLRNFKKQATRNSVKPTVDSLRLPTFTEFQIATPPLREQRAIAAALSDVDALISALDKLIAKKRAVKTAAMQQLLTGKQRLPGFSGEWEMKMLEEVADVDSDNLPADTDPDYEFNYISLEDVARGILRGFSHQRFSSSPSRARRRVRARDVLVSTVRPNLKPHLMFSVSEGDWVCSTGFSLVRCKKQLASPGFVYHHLFHGVVPRQIETLIAGSNYPAISAKDVRGFQLPMPPLEEQTAIATVLPDMDAEIEALEARQEKTRRVKRGMMQELLTGRTRLV